MPPDLPRGMKIKDHDFKAFISEAQIQEAVQAIATRINTDYKKKTPLFLPVLNGSFMFAADVFRQLDIEAEISFIKLASYKGTSSSGNIVTSIGLEENLQGRHIIIVEDIIDTGKTLHAFLPEVLQRQPASVKIAAFLTKPAALQFDVHADYFCFEIDNKFVVGYGLDYDGLGRNLPELYILKD